MQILNRLAREVRDSGPIKHGVLAVKCQMAPSTLYSYKSALLGLFQDIRFDGEFFFSLVPKTKDLEPASETSSPPGSELPPETEGS